jgi:hypothetical protein
MNAKSFSRRAFLTLAAASLISPAAAAPPPVTGLPPNILQVIAGTADSWDSNRGRIQLFERASASAPWQPAFPKPIPVLFGRNGLAWGNGCLPVPHGQNSIPSTREKDRRAKGIIVG